VTAERRRTTFFALLAVVAAAALAGCGGGSGGGRPDAASGRTIVVDVPRGTAARIARGEPVDIVGDRIEARVGDRLRLVNHDSRSHMIGPFLVGPGQRVESLLARAGSYEGECSLHRDRRKVTIVVADR